MENLTKKQLKKKKMRWVKVPFWLAGIALVLGTGAYLSYIYLINPGARADNVQIDLGFDLKQTEHWSSSEQQKWSFLDKLEDGEYPNIKQIVENKTDRLWEKLWNLAEYPGVKREHSDYTDYYLMHQGINSGHDSYIPDPDLGGSASSINDLVHGGKIDKMPNNSDLFESTSNRKVKYPYPDMGSSTTKIEQFEIWRMNALMKLNNDIEVFANNQQFALDEWQPLGSLYNLDNFGSNGVFSPKNTHFSAEQACYVPGRNYAIDYAGTHLKQDGQNTEEVYVPGFTEREIDINSISINGEPLANTNYECEIRLTKYNASSGNGGVITSSQAKWYQQKSKLDNKYYGAWMSDEVNIWVKLTEKTTEYPSAENFAATAGDEKVTLNWDTPDPIMDNLKGYRLLRSDDNGATYNKIKDITDYNVTSHLDTNLTNNKKYYYRIYAVYNTFEDQGRKLSDYREVNVTPTESGGSQVPPAKPSYFEATPGDRKVSLEWGKPNGTNKSLSSKLIGYRLRRTLASDSSKKVTSGVSGSKTWNIENPNQLTKTDTGLTNNKEYKYLIWAVYGSFEKPELSKSLSAVATPTAGAPQKPPKPENLSAEGGDNQVALTWEVGSNSESLGSSAGSADSLTTKDHYFNVYRSGTSIDDSSSVLDSKKASKSGYARINKEWIKGTGYTDNDSALQDGKTYYYRVKEVSSIAGEGPFSDEATATLQGENILPAPLNFTAESKWKQDQIMLSWEKVEDAAGYIIHYSKTDSPDSEKTIKIEDGEVTGSNVLFSDVEYAQEYQFNIAALDNNETEGNKAHANAKPIIPGDLGNQTGQLQPNKIVDIDDFRMLISLWVDYNITGELDEDGKAGDFDKDGMIDYNDVLAWKELYNDYINYN